MILMRFIMLLLALSLVSCGDSITKANDLSQVVDAHFEYSKIESELVEGNRHISFYSVYVDVYEITGRVKNKSGINIRKAEFYIAPHQGDDDVGYGSSLEIEDFIDNTTRDFEDTVWVLPGKKPDRFVITYAP